MRAASLCRRLKASETVGEHGRLACIDHDRGDRGRLEVRPGPSRDAPLSVLRRSPPRSLGVYAGRTRRNGSAEAAIIGRTVDVIGARLARFGSGAARFGLIHADMRLANLLVDATMSASSTSTIADGLVPLRFRHHVVVSRMIP